MRKTEFRNWLDGKIKKRPISDCISRCHSIEKSFDVDLDEEYRKDGGSYILSRLEYTIDDERKSAPAPDGFFFQRRSVHTALGWLIIAQQQKSIFSLLAQTE